MSEEQIGHYRIEKKLGEGGVGEVFLAIDPELDRTVAIKRLRPELACRPQIVERFRSEARTLAQLNHPNIATLYAFERDEDSLLMVMEYVEGETLSALLRREGAMTLERAVPLVVQALDGIGHAHRLGIVHRDIKGPNLMLRADGVLKVMDFGIARVVGTERVTQLGQLVGTPEFMSPEQIRGQDTDARSDVYSLGILFYALLTGQIPFSSSSGYDLMKAQIEEAPPSLLEAAPHLPAPLDDVLARALAKDPAQRFQTAEEFRTALVPFLARRRTEDATERLPEGFGAARRVDAGPTLILGAPFDAQDTEDAPPIEPAASEIAAPTTPTPERKHPAPPQRPALDDMPTRLLLDPLSAATVVRCEEEADRTPRAHRLGWILAPSLIALLVMGLDVVWRDLRSGASSEAETGPIAAVTATSPAAAPPAIAAPEPVRRDTDPFSRRFPAPMIAADTASSTTPNPLDPQATISAPTPAIDETSPPPKSVAEKSTAPPKAAGSKPSVASRPPRAVAKKATTPRTAAPKTSSPRSTSPPAARDRAPEETSPQESKGWMIRR